MTTVDRPNRDALNRALDIYRDAMRPFIVRTLRGVQGQRVEDVIGRSLNDRQADQFRLNMRRTSNDVEASIDVGDFPSLIGRNWRDAFRHRFPDGDQTIQSVSWMVKSARDTASHPGTQDVDEEFTRSRLFDIIDVLSKINAPQERERVESIRDAHCSPKNPCRRRSLQ